MDLPHALKNLIENGTKIEYFDNGLVIQINKNIKVLEYGKKNLKILTQTQQNKLLLQAREEENETKGLTFANQKKKVQKQPQKQIDDEEDFISYEPQEETQETVGLNYANQNESNDDSISEVREKPLKKQVRKRVVKTSKTPQINYTNPQLDLEELIRKQIFKIKINQTLALMPTAKLHKRCGLMLSNMSIRLFGGRLAARGPIDLKMNDFEHTAIFFILYYLQNNEIL
ncbi:MAG: hypothetical protein EZS28_010764 [Streblomastix strix]|uniref:Uncharacterized protein n=1 Tax=Streblomastix strix TaxID=222440 RepID=A0A5J4WHE2_9EUKA|nr:MAG: hypothetical protein EZS28_010764 [Streblomastix strix]